MAPHEAAEEVRSRYLERLRNLAILDPACGSGNFLYLALQAVKDLELKANLECEALGLAPRGPAVGPEIVHGIEINPLAAELARTTIWIGDIQWGHWLSTNLMALSSKRNGRRRSSSLEIHRSLAPN